MEEVRVASDPCPSTTEGIAPWRPALRFLGLFGTCRDAVGLNRLLRILFWPVRSTWFEPLIEFVEFFSPLEDLEILADEIPMQVFRMQFH